MRTLTLTKLFGLIVLIIFVLIDFGACKTNDGADPDIRYTVGVAEFVYTREEPVTIPTNPDLTHLTIIFKRPIDGVEIMPSIRMTRITEGKFRAVVDAKFAYDESLNYQIEHEAGIADAKLGVIGVPYSGITGYGLEIYINGYTVKKRVVPKEGCPGSTKTLFYVIPN